MSTDFDCTLDRTIDNSFDMYCGLAPSIDVSTVEIFAARIEHIATDIRFIEASSKVDKQFITSFAHLNDEQNNE